MQILVDKADANAKQLCLTSNYTSSDFNRESEKNIKSLKYNICLGESKTFIKELYIINYTKGAVDLQKGFLKNVDRPKSMPNRQMIYDPIFSTWAIYKKTIDDEKLREYFEAIKENGYRASNFEIADGYEVAYGDHSFDDAKFPNIKGRGGFFWDFENKNPNSMGKKS